MTGGLPEKFAANFIDDLMDDYEEEKNQKLPGEPDPVVDWGTADEFYAKCEETFGDQNKKLKAEQQLALLRQGTRTAEEYLQEFEQLVRTAGYQRGHFDVLIKYFHEQVKTSVIDKIYAAGKLPKYYTDWKEAILNVDGLER
jgi:5-methylcytosine-specific restriction endonuclease McrBC regulatory subunit McrC